MEQLNSGMNQDANPIYQPKGTTRFNLNTVIDDRNAEQGQIVSDEGNKLCVQFDNSSLVGYSLIGSHRLSNNSKLLFITDNTHSVIGIQTECNFEIIINSDCLNFKTTKRVSVLSKVINGCERVIYFTDTYNSYRSINIDSLEQYLLSGETIASANLSGTGWDCGLFKHFYDYNYPNILLESVNDGGGNLKVGTYTFSIRYIDNQGNATNWMPFTQLIPVTLGKVGTTLIDPNDVINIKGSTNYRVEDGNTIGITTGTSKSITLNVVGIDVRFSFIQFAVIEYVEDIKVPTNYYILEKLAINGSSMDYTYRGFDPSNTIAATLNELTIPTVSIDTVHAHAQNAGRLFLTNVKEYERDWSEFQRSACKIKSSWLANVSDYYGLGVNNVSPQRAYYYFNRKSFMRDEIYAFGIVYVFKDGSQSPVFHIPGTSADNIDRLSNLTTFQANSHNRQNGGTLVDRELLTVVTTPSSQSALEVAESDVKHLGLTIGNTVERWKVFNTAIETNRIAYSGSGTVGPKNHFAAVGLMSFWECETSAYPEVKDCNGDYIYDTDYYGNVLAGTPIRHHKFPDTTLVEHAFGVRDVSMSNDLEKVHSFQNSFITIQLDNIIVPAAYINEVQGYFIVRAERNSVNSTVVDKGLFNRTSVSTDGGPINYLVSCDGRQAHGSNPLTEPIDPIESKKMGCLASSINLQGRWGTSWDRTAVRGDYIKFEGIWRAYRRVGLPTFKESWITDLSNPSLNQTNIKIVESKLVASGTEDLISGSTINIAAFDWMNDTNFISTEDEIYWLSANVKWRQTYYVAVKKYIPDLHGELSSIKYIKTSRDIYPTSTTSINLIYGGDVYITNFSKAYYAAAFITPPTMGDSLTDPHDDPDFGCVVFNFAEEPINLSLRHYGTALYERHPEPLHNNTYGWCADLPINYATLDMVDFDGDKSYYRQWKALNPDYHVESNISVYLPLPTFHNWCDNCGGKKPNFIYYSDKSSAFNVSDNYRIVRPLNVENLFPEDGAITGLFVDKDRLFATTANSVIFLPTKPQTLQGDGTTVYTGTGDVLSAPPKKLVSSEIGYAGVEDKFGINVNEFGTVLIDTVRGKVFLLGEGLEEISNHGLRAFFRDNLPFKLKKLIPTLDESNYYTNINGIGLLATYDQKYRRLILHKRDYTPINFGGLLPEIPLPDITYYVLESDGRLRWYRNDVEIFASNSTYFTNHSFTLSYSFANKCWTSFHSYMPDFMYNDSETFYTFIQGLNSQLQGVWKHGTEFLKYYNNSFQHIIEIVLTPNFQTGVYDDVLMSTKALSPASKVYMQEKNVFFDKIWVYNEIQSSGLKTLLPISETDMGMSVYNNSYSVSNVICRNVEEYWRLQLPRDLVDLTYSGPTATSNWTNILGNFNLVNGYQGYIDKIASGIISTTKLMQNVSRMRSKYVFVRFYFDSQASTRLVTDLAHSNKRPSIR
jgi:hypothetical protein